MFRGVCVFLILIFVASVSAADVSYLYRNDGKIDQRVLDVFDEMGVSYELVHEKDASLASGVVFAGDERFREEVSILDGAIIMSYHNGYDWGLTDRDGISQMGATKPLFVQQGSDLVVYDRAFMRQRIAVPYYYLDALNKHEASRQIAGCMASSSGDNFGDVIAYFDSGTELLNGLTTTENICFFGIVKSEYWTPAARELFKDCVSFALGQSGAQDDPASVQECVVDSDCGTLEVSDLFCSDDDSVHQTETSYSCVFDAANNSVCESSSINLTHEVCLFGCGNGQCLNEESEILCFDDSDCPASEFSGLYCAEGTEVYDENVYQLVTDYVCENPGSFSSACVAFEEEFLIEDCAFGCFEGACSEETLCMIDSDCGNEILSGLFCDGNDVVQTSSGASCIEHSCVARNEQVVVETCEFGCLEGMCEEEPISLELHDIGFAPTNTYPEGLRVQDESNNDIVDQSLLCGERYKVSLRTRNFGDFTENVRFSGSIGSVEVQHSLIETFEVDDAPSRSKTITLELEEGTYDLEVEIILEGVIDAVPENNFASRTFFVECGGI